MIERTEEMEAHVCGSDPKVVVNEGSDYYCSGVQARSCRKLSNVGSIAISHESADEGIQGLEDDHECSRGGSGMLMHDSVSIRSRLLLTIRNRSLWSQLRVPELQAIHKQLAAFKCTKVKKELIEVIIERCELLIATGGADLLQRYADLMSAGMSDLDLLKASADVLLPAMDMSFPTLDCQQLTQRLNLSDLSSRRAAVTRHRHGRDMYSELSIDELIDPHIDHIVERQLMAYAMLTAGLGTQDSCKDALCLPIHGLANDCKNLNITSADLNNSKGDSFTQFIKEDRLTGHPRSLHVVLYSTTSGKERTIAKYTVNVMNALQDAVPAMEADLRYLRRLDGHATGQQFEKVADRLAELFDKAAVQEYDNEVRLTRSTARFKNITLEGV